MKKLMLLLVYGLLWNTAALAETPMDAFKYLPVQDGGRIKPYDTFARETLQLVHGKQTFQGRPAIEVVTTWMLVPEVWQQKKLIQINHRGLKDALKLKAEESLFTPEEILVNDRVGYVFTELSNKQATHEKLDPYYQAVQRLQNQIGIFLAIKAGHAIHVLPRQPEVEQTEGYSHGITLPKAARSNAWYEVAELTGEGAEKFGRIQKGFVHVLPGIPNADTENKASAQEFSQAIADFKSFAATQNPKEKPSYADGLKDIAIEVHYNDLQPFLWTWILYMIAALTMAFAWLSKKNYVYKLAWFFALAAFAMHIYGFSLRVYLTGRPPVSNMYESVVWVSFGVVLFSIIFEAIQKRYFVLLAGTSVAVLCLIVADQAPAILDSSLQPLEPVLRSNLWLTIHVLTITISYSAFFLAFGMGDLGLFYYLIGDTPGSARLKSIQQSIYRVMQVGVVLLATGIIMGGVWADYSWGRFWGWDPKETWALIALLGYIAILHGRLAGWLREFGLIAAAVVSFSLVMMAWYGVNYVLGAGLHSYGFGAGGVQYVAGFVLMHLLYVAYVSYVVTQRRAHPPVAKV